MVGAARPSFYGQVHSAIREQLGSAGASLRLKPWDRKFPDLDHETCAILPLIIRELIMFIPSIRRLNVNN